MMRVLPAIISGGISDSLLTDLVSWWSFDEESGTRYDAHGPNDLTDNNTVGYGAGEYGNAALFVDGNGEYLDRSSPTGLAANNRDFSVYVSAKFNTLGAGKYNTLLQVGAIPKNPADTDYYLFVDDIGSANVQVILNLPDGSTENELQCSDFGDLSTGVLYHILFDYAAATKAVSVTINGTTQSDTFGDTNNDGGNIIFANNLVGSADDLDGLIDSAAFWGRLLTAGEKTRLMAGMAYPG